MKQPELGKKITELRKEKGMTQEDVVIECNINVRTLQRIEAGEVTPRSYTIKAILDVLGYNLDELAQGSGGFYQRVKAFSERLLFLKMEDDSQEFIHKQLRISLFFGVVYFIIGAIEGFAEVAKYMNNEMVLTVPFYIIVKIVVLISFIFFQRGFVLIAHLLSNLLLRIASYALILFISLLISYDLFTIASPVNNIALVAFSITFGFVSIIYGISFMQMRKLESRIARNIGILELIAGICLLTVALAIISELIFIASEIFQLIFIFKFMSNTSYYLTKIKQ